MSVASYKSDFENTDQDTAKVRLGFVIAEYYMTRNIDSVLFYLESTEPFIDKNSIEYGYYLQGIAMCFEAQKDLKKAVFYIDMAIDFFKSRGTAENCVAVLTNKIRLHILQNEITEASQLINQILDFYRKLPESNLTESLQIDYITTLGFKGFIECAAGQHETALKSQEKAYQMAVEINDSLRMFEVQSMMGKEYIHTGELEKGLTTFKQMLDFVRRLGLSYYYGQIESAITLRYAELGNLDSSKVYYDQVIDFLETEGDFVIEKEIVLLDLGRTDLIFGNVELGIERCKLGYEYAKQNDLDIYLHDACECLKMGYKKLGRYSEALLYSEELLEISKSNESHDSEISFVLSEERMAHADKLYQSKLASQKQKFIIEQQNSEINTSTLITIGLTFFISILVVLIVIILYQYTKVRRQKVTLSRSNEEKIALLREVHHRVKNNFQVIHSLLNLHANSAENESIAHSLRQAQNRIKTMAIVHENLYSADNVDKIDMDKYLTSLSSYICDSFNDSLVEFVGEVKANNIHFSINESIPIGLIVNELLTNSGKHGADIEGKIQFRLDLRKIENHYLLLYKDNGPGLPKDLDLENLNSLGIELIEILAEQIDGSVEFSSNAGFQCCVKFKLPV